jgi:hypothetical protein
MLKKTLFVAILAGGTVFQGCLGGLNFWTNSWGRAIWLILNEELFG